MASIDGSWNLTITVTDLQVERTLRVTGDLNVGGVMVQLVEALDIAMDWSDHSLWWPERNTWLTRSRSTLNQYNVQADAKLHFTPMHKNVRVQLPDLQIIDQRMDFSRNVFSAVILLCKELGIRHPEELSIMRYLDKDDLKKSIKENLNQKKKKDSKDEMVMGVNGNGTVHHSSSGSLDRLSPFSRSPAGPSPNNTLNRTPGLTPGPTMTPGVSSYSANSVSPYNTFNSTFNANGTMSPGSMYSLSFETCMENALANSPPVSIRDAQPFLYKPKNYVEKARINYSWLDSSKSLMEQGIRDNDFILLKYKFFSFYDLNQKYDAVRINQIYEQAKWNILSEEVDCTEEEMMMFAALQLQIQTQASQPQANDSMMDNGGHSLDTDDIDADLTNLEESLEGSMLSSPGDITAIPELSDEIKFLKPKKLLLRKSYSRAWCTFKDTHIAFYKSRGDSQGAPFMRINTKGCESHPDLNISSKKYGMKLFVPESDGMSEVWLRFDMEEQYCKWMAACKLASQGKTMADSSYETEVQSLKTMLSRQHLSTQPGTSPTIQVDINSEDFVAPRFYKKFKSKQLQQRILETHANVQNLNLIDAKMAFIKAWQALPDFGITYFIIKQKGAKKEELLGVAYNRIIRMDLSSGDSLKSWRYNTLKSWHVNWEVKHVFLEFEGERLTFSCLNADCKVVHEYIGGYIFLTMRSQDKNQTLNEELFHKLTGGWNKSIVL
ncbi:LOW QUALITY PROTEIN: fermitin family homolog 2-like [Pecten maximus]|uniref:LOW QUALITY PROTEIN: fermitin family homolog 2-like n=1 Tax=Pecten maximus TaxID=6579 RepID=UPI0014580FEC|nr:LOW QUALITY PROTEIN: fermitin family homolog 2-like [Pecten maximus]